MSAPPDFSSEAYWSTRFEKETSFEWLTGNGPILPLVTETVKDVLAARAAEGSATQGLKVLHYGCGTSNLGTEVYEALFAAFPFDLPGTAVTEDVSSSAPGTRGDELLVVDADYVASSLRNRNGPVRLTQLDVLSPESLKHCTDDFAPGGWDIILDKSTADAISCGPDVRRPSKHQPTTDGSGRVQRLSGHVAGSEGQDGEGGEEKVEPIVALCDNLAEVIRPGGRWICISYSSTRFSHLDSSIAPHASPRNKHDLVGRWKVLKKEQITRSFMAEGRTVSDGKGGTRTVYEPETGIWAYVLAYGPTCWNGHDLIDV